MLNKIIGVFVFYDRDGIVDEYVLYLLDSIKLYLEKMIIVSNGYLDESNRSILSARADYYFERENLGFDFGAWKDIFVYKFPRGFWDNYETVLCFNDTFYGPIFSLDAVFEKMIYSNADLWGLTRFGCVQMNGHVVEPFIQTYFWAVKTKLLHSNCFFEFWNGINDRAETFPEVQNYEILLSQFFQENGFVIDTFINTEEFETNKIGVKLNRETNRAVDKFELLYLIQNGFPFVKRKNFFYSRKTINEVKLNTDLVRVMNYISTETNYDTHMIFDNILRLKEPEVVSMSLNQNYVINDEFCSESANIDNVLVIAVRTEMNKDILDGYIVDLDLHNIMVVDEFQTNLQFPQIKGSFFEDLNTYLNQNDKISYVCIIGEFSHAFNQKSAYFSYQRMLYDNLIKSRNYIEKITLLLSKNDYVAAIRPIIKNNINNKYVRGNEPVGIWIKKEVFKKYLNMKPKFVFNGNKHIVINEMIFELSKYVIKNGYMIPNIISGEYASVLLTNYLNDL